MKEGEEKKKEEGDGRLGYRGVEGGGGCITIWRGSEGKWAPRTAIAGNLTATGLLELELRMEQHQI